MCEGKEIKESGGKGIALRQIQWKMSLILELSIHTIT
jgi:hypothetical protein